MYVQIGVGGSKRQRQTPLQHSLLIRANRLEMSFKRSDLRLIQNGAVEDRPQKGAGLCCRYLVKFLSKLAQDSELNKMTPSNIAIVLGPNLLWAKTEG